MKTKKHITILLVLGSFMAIAGTSSANVVSFSDNVNFDHDQVVSVIFYGCHSILDYTFLSDTVSLSQFDPGLGILKSVELIVESAIDVDTYYYYFYDYHTTSQHWYSDVVGNVNGLEATFSQDHNHHTTGMGYYNHIFSIDGTASDSTSSDLAAFIGTGTVDVDITGDDRLCCWWNPYLHFDTDTYGTVTATLTYTYAMRVDIKPGSCPNPFNPKSKGRVPIAIVGTGDVDLTTIDLATFELTPEGGDPVSPVDAEMIDSTQPGDYNPEDCYDCFNADDYLTDTDGDGIPDTYLGDGIDDLVLYFDTQELAAALSGAEKGACIELTLTGETLSGEPIEGSDSVLMLK